ncbi:MAG TPA: TetR/AcrR family transcriptional regulator [Gammaproteobacteria bacterium]|jgi:AcrR family transcriptional regulator|nr:TetR/AcrR family transcriptional regulator [Gammaproteobacteria bacterium]
MTEIARPSLRERKFARTRLSLADAVTNHLEAASFESLSVKALCERVQISEATFFNYFPKKEDLIVYLDRLWTLELNWYGRQATEQKRGLSVIETLFRYTSIQIQKKPGLMGEIIAHEARARERHAGPEITPAERMIAFSDLDDINSLPDDSLENLLRSSLQAGIDQGELPPNTAIAAAMVALVSIFYGVPLAMQHANPAAISAMYRQQLALLWAGLRAVAQK